MDVLVVEVCRYKTLVFGSVLHTAEALRGLGAIVKLDNGFEVRSMDGPNLYGPIFYICGRESSEDRKPFYYEYEDEDEAKAAVENIRKAVRKINSKYGRGTSSGLNVELVR